MDARTDRCIDTQREMAASSPNDAEKNAYPNVENETRSFFLTLSKM